MIYNNMFDNKTSERRVWTEGEDMALKQLYESLRINKWSHIAQQLEEEFGFAGRTGKQCRERYNNHLDPALCRDSWTFDEEKVLYRLHDQLGNKWAVISHRLGPGRTDNSVKNHYFSRLRKSLRRLNKVIHDKYKKQVREIQTKILYKIIEASQEKFKLQPMCEPDVSEYACRLKNKILLFSYEQGEHDLYKDDVSVRGLISQIVQFNRNYKRKPKKFRKVGQSSNEAIEEQPKRSLKRITAKITSISEFNEGSRSSFLITSKNRMESQSEDEEDFQDDINPNLQKIYTQKQKMISPIILTSNPRLIEEKMEKQEKTVQNSEQILEALGLLEDDLLAPHPNLMKKKTSVMSSEHPQENEEFKFFEDSEVEMRIMCAPMLTSLKKESMEDRLFH